MSKQNDSDNINAQEVEDLNERFDLPLISLPRGRGEWVHDNADMRKALGLPLKTKFTRAQMDAVLTVLQYLDGRGEA